jgi:hypothetical protein
VLQTQGEHARRLQAKVWLMLPCERKAQQLPFDWRPRLELQSMEQQSMERHARMLRLKSRPLSVSATMESC